MRALPVLLAGLLLAPCAHGADDASKASLRLADTCLRALERVVRRRAAARGAFDLLDTTERALRKLVPPARPPFDSAGGASDATGRVNRRRLRTWRRALERFAGEREDLARRWVRLLGRLARLDARRPPDAFAFELRIQRRALDLLVRTERGDAGRAVTTAIEAWLSSDAPWVAARFLVDAFAALPRFASPDVLRWLCRTFVGREREHAAVQVVLHGPGGVAEELTVDLPGLALDAIAGHEGLAGGARRDAVRLLIRTYRPLEERAGRGPAERRCWAHVGPAVRRATWRLAGRPREGLAAVPPTLLEMDVWFHRHGGPDAEAWTD